MLFKAFILGRNPFLELVKGPWAAGTSPGFFSVPGASAVGVSPGEARCGLQKGRWFHGKPKLCRGGR